MNTHQHEKAVVLVVDDEVLVRMVAVSLLEDAGLEAIEAGDAEEALGLLEEHPEIDILFTDINMPGAFDGLVLARKVRERRPDVQIIVTSGRVQLTKSELPAHGAFLAKPYGCDAMLSLIGRPGLNARRSVQ